MDLVDKKIVSALDKDSRISIVQIAKQARTNPETARFRLTRLFSSGKIKYSVAIINAALLGYSRYELLLKLQNINEDKKKEIVDFLKSDKNVGWIGLFDSSYDMGIILLVKNQLELASAIESIDKNYNKYIMKRTLAITLRGDFFPRDYLIGKDRTMTKESSYDVSVKTADLDPDDDRICKLLAIDSRISALEISRKVKCSVDKVISRMKRLRKDNIISEYALVLDNEKIDQLHYKILIYLNNKSEDEIRKMLSFAKSNNRVIAIIKTLAEWDYEIDLEIENVKQLQDFTMQLTKNFSGIIRDYLTIRVIEMPKYNFYP
jgi:DNA-binding Lrp family transcriptional regulator